MDEKNTAFACLGVAVITAVVMVVAAIIQGWVLSVMWGWFVVPLFHLPPLTIPYALGIAFLIGMLLQRPNGEQRSERADWRKVSIAVLSPLATLLFGWVVHLFV